MRPHYRGHRFPAAATVADILVFLAENGVPPGALIVLHPSFNDGRGGTTVDAVLVEVAWVEDRPATPADAARENQGYQE